MGIGLCNLKFAKKTFEELSKYFIIMIAVIGPSEEEIDCFPN